ncbi:MAG: hypothetical protein AVO33_05320 [delta proteobacterium ML8_F1]|nr:MAG: hypothetical protein AVO33_05320 [delta proteobacterium ML8_F1]
MKYRSVTDVRCAYPFLYDEDSRSDFEVLSDQITVEIAMVIALLQESSYAELIQDLRLFQEKTMDLNGSVRGRIGVSEEDLAHAINRYDHYKGMAQKSDSGFVLPSGSPGALSAHRVRGMFKALVRVMRRVEAEGFTVAPVLFDYANVMSNVFFVVAGAINFSEGEKPIPYESRNYPISPKSPPPPPGE